MPAKSAIAPHRAAGVRASTLSCRPSISCAGALGQVGVDPARQHGVGLDVVGGPGDRAGAGELHDAALARGVGRREAGAEDRHHRADIDDLAAACRLHRGVDRLRAQERAGEVGLDDAVPFLEIERVRRLADVDAGVVDENVDPAEFALTRCSTMAATAALSVTSAMTDIALTPRCLSSATAAFDFRLIAPDDRDSGAGFRQSARHAEPDAAIAAGDDRHLAAEIEESRFHDCHPDGVWPRRERA